MKLAGVIGRAALGAAALLCAQQAHAAGTTANTPVTNTVTVNYEIANAAQPAVTGTATFVVDRKVIVTVSELSGTATGPVVPGQQNAVTAFKVTNSSNAALDFALAGANKINGAATAFGAAAESQDVENIDVFVDANGNGTYEAGADIATHIDALAADGEATVFIVADVPAGAATGQIASVTLKATTHENDGAATLGAVVAQTVGADTPGTMDTVFADLAGVAAGDVARDGAHSDDDDYNIMVTALSITKASRVISDGFSAATDAKAIPNAVLEYCIIVFNPSTTNAVTSVVLSDPLPAQVAYNTGTLFSAVTPTGGTSCMTEDGIAEDDDATDTGGEADGFTASYDTGTKTIAATIGSIAANTRTAMRFRVTIQ